MINQEYLRGFFDKKDYILTVKHSNYKKHATVLTKLSIAEGADIIVACGGDGTVNEVASCLVHTNIALGIIPLGSGNGLASNLKIPKDVGLAINLIKKASIKTIDVGCVNEHYFFSNTGIGIDAQVIRHYENSNKRKLVGYLGSSIKALKNLHYKNKITIEVNNQTIQTYPFLVFISNSNEMGYKLSLTPLASLEDGLLDVLVVSKMSWMKSLYFGLLVLLKKPHLVTEAKYYQSKTIKIKKADPSAFESQIDGEFFTIDQHDLKVSLLENSLRIIY